MEDKNSSFSSDKFLKDNLSYRLTLTELLISGRFFPGWLTDKSRKVLPLGSGELVEYDRLTLLDSLIIRSESVIFFMPFEILFGLKFCSFDFIEPGLLLFIVLRLVIGNVGQCW